MHTYTLHDKKSLNKGNNEMTEHRAIFQRDNRNSYIEEEQTTQWPKENK